MKDTKTEEDTLENNSKKYLGKKFRLWCGGQEGDWEEVYFYDLPVHIQLDPEPYLLK